MNLAYIRSRTSGVFGRLQRLACGRKRDSSKGDTTSLLARPVDDPMVVDRSQRIPLIIKNMHRSGTLLDVGCGGMRQTTFDLVSATGQYELVVGVDAYEESINERKRWAAQRQDAKRFMFIHGEIQKMRFDRRFDVILLSHVMEHLSLAEAESVLGYLWSICDRQMILETPNEFEDGRNAVAEFGNPYQKHACLVDQSFMTRHEFVKLLTYFQESGFSNSVYTRTRSDEKG